MPDYSYHLKLATPTEALKLLASVAQETNGRLPENIRLTIQDGIGAVPVTLYLPDEEIQRRRNNEKANRIKAFLICYETLTNRQVQRHPTPNDTQPITQGLADLLLGSQHGVKTAVAEPHQYLLLHQTAIQDEAIERLQSLQFHALTTAMTVADIEPPIYLYDVRIDRDRKTTFLNYLKTGTFTPENILQGFYEQEKYLFMTQGQQPGQEALTHFMHLLHHAPHLLSLPASDEWHHEHLIALQIGSETRQFFTLANLHFLSQKEADTNITSYTHFELHHLQATAEKMRALQEAIKETDPLVGYRLQLHPLTYPHQSSARDLQRLDAELAELEYKRAYLQSISVAKPTLLRFTQQQLPAFADVLRSLPEHILRNGSLYYGFQSSTQHPEGVHYLFMEPDEAHRANLNLLYLWHHPDGPTMRFWLDPFWMQNYGAPQNKSLLFVPYKQALLPSLHEWQPEQMDSYLRSMLQQWFHGHNDVQHIPATPLYLFEPYHDNILISVLDRAALQPLRTQLGWLNDNLVSQSNYGPHLQTFIKELADELTREQLAKAVTERAAEQIAAFEQAADHVDKAITEKTAVLTEEITAQLERLVAETKETTKQAQNLNTRIIALKAHYTQMQQLVNATEQQEHLTNMQTETLTEESQQLHKKVETAVANAKKTQEHIDNTLGYQVNRLTRLYNDLQQQLRN